MRFSVAILTVFAGSALLASAALAKPGASCGGHPRVACDANEWCDFPDEHVCGVPDFTGVCKASLPLCKDVADVREVCGCDGKDYPNDCEAHRAGTDVARIGKCDGKPKAR